MTYFYARQLESLMKQCIRIFSSFEYKTGANASGPGEMLPVPCKYGDASRMVQQINKNNSENTAISAPMFAVYIKEIEPAPNRRKGPSLEHNMSVTERAIDPVTGRYTADPGNKYRIDLLMPVPVDVRIQVDLLTSNTSQLWQLFEQVTLLFNPAQDLQINDNPFDWSALTYIELESHTYNTKSIPVGVDDSFNVTSWVFKVPYWINPPAKVKKVFDIRNIITDTGPDGTNSVLSWEPGDFSQTVTSAGNYKVNINGNTATLLNQFGSPTDVNSNVYNWKAVIDSLGHYVPSTTMLRLRPVANISDTTLDIYAYFTYNEEINKLDLTFLQNTVPKATVAGVTAIIDPRVNFPGNGVDITPPLYTRYLILAEIPANTVAWGSFHADSNSIIEWNGTAWTVSLEPSVDNEDSIVENLSNNKLYILVQNTWVSVVEGTYSQGYWDLTFLQDTLGSSSITVI